MVASSGKNLCIETFEAKWLNFAQMVEKIIREQEGIIGPIALEQARKVSGLTIGRNTRLNLKVIKRK